MIKTLVSALFAVGISASVAYATPLFPNQGNIVMGYYSDWSVYNTEHPDFYPGSTGGSQDPAKIQILKDKLKEVNSVAYAFLEMDPSGSVRFPDPWGDLSPSDMGFCADNAVICSGKTGQWDLGYGLFDAFANDSSITNKIISIGGYGHQQDWTYALSHPDTFVKSLIIIFKQYPHLNGIDIDAEPLSWVNEGPGPQKMIALLKELRTRLDSNGLSNVVISFPIAANPTDIENFGAENWKQLMQSVSYIGLMGYDLHGEFDYDAAKGYGVTDIQTQLYDDNPEDVSHFDDIDAIDMLVKMGVEKSHITLGLPAYARAVSGLSGNGVGAHFTSVPAGDLDPSCSTTPGASDSCGGMESEWGLYDKLIKNPGEIQAVMAQGVDDGAYVNESYNGVNTFFSFDSYDSAATKAQYARNNGLGGVFFWTLSTASPVKTASGELNQNSMLNGVHMVYMG